MTKDAFDRYVQNLSLEALWQICDDAEEWRDTGALTNDSALRRHARSAVDPMHSTPQVSAMLSLVTAAWREIALRKSTFVIVKDTYPYAGGTGYAGTLCEKAKVVPGKVYTSREEAKRSARFLGEDFSIKPYEDSSDSFANTVVNILKQFVEFYRDNPKKVPTSLKKVVEYGSKVLEQRP